MSKRQSILTWSARITVGIVLVLWCSPLIPPHRFYWAGVFSLFIPVFALANLICLLFFVFTRSKMVWVAVVNGLLYGYFLISSFSWIDREKELDGFRLITYNVNKLRYSNGSYGKFDRAEVRSLRSDFAQWIGEEKFSVVAMQEMLELKQDPFDLPGYQKIFSGKQLVNQDQLGVAIFSKLPVVEHGVVELSTRSFNRLLWVDVVFHSDTLRVITVHLRSYDFQRESLAKDFNQLTTGVAVRSWQAKLVHDAVMQSPHPVILAGDFNEMAFSNVYRSLTQQLHDSFLNSGDGVEYTYRVLGLFPVRIDYILTSPSLLTSDYQVWHEASWSDHAPVSVSINTKR